MAAGIFGNGRQCAGSGRARTPRDLPGCTRHRAAHRHAVRVEDDLRDAAAIRGSRGLQSGALVRLEGRVVGRTREAHAGPVLHDEVRGVKGLSLRDFKLVEATVPSPADPGFAVVTIDRSPNRVLPGGCSVHVEGDDCPLPDGRHVMPGIRAGGPSAQDPTLHVVFAPVELHIMDVVELANRNLSSIGSRVILAPGVYEIPVTVARQERRIEPHFEGEVRVPKTKIGMIVGPNRRGTGRKPRGLTRDARDVGGSPRGLGVEVGPAGGQVVRSAVLSIAVQMQLQNHLGRLDRHIVGGRITKPVDVRHLGVEPVVSGSRAGPGGLVIGIGAAGRARRNIVNIEGDVGYRAVRVGGGGLEGEVVAVAEACAGGRADYQDSRGRSNSLAGRGRSQPSCQFGAGIDRAIGDYRDWDRIVVPRRAVPTILIGGTLAITQGKRDGALPESDGGRRKPLQG